MNKIEVVINSVSATMWIVNTIAILVQNKPVEPIFVALLTFLLAISALYHLLNSINK